MYGAMGQADKAEDAENKTGDMSTEQDETKDEKTEEEGAGESALLPKSICPGMDLKPGDDLPLKVVAIHGDEIEVEYSKESTKGDRDRKGGSMDNGSPKGKSYQGIGSRMMAGMGEG